MCLFTIIDKDCSSGNAFHSMKTDISHESVTNSRWQVFSGAIAAPVFIITFLIEGAIRPNYSPLRHAVSSLSIGNLGWIQSANFIVTGTLLFIFALKLWNIFRRPKGSTWGPLLISILSIGLIGAGIFATDPIAGYPPGAALVRTARGILHDAFSIPFFFGLPAACFIFSRQFYKMRQHRWAIYSITSGTVMIAAFVFASLGFQKFVVFVAFAGLFQRISIAVGFCWLTMLAFFLLRVARNSSR